MGRQSSRNFAAAQPRAVLSTGQLLRMLRELASAKHQCSGCRHKWRPRSAHRFRWAPKFRPRRSRTFPGRPGRGSPHNSARAIGGWRERAARCRTSSFRCDTRMMRCIVRTFWFAWNWRRRHLLRSSHTGSCDSRYRSRNRERRESCARSRRSRRAGGAVRRCTVGTSHGSPSGEPPGTLCNIEAS
jgi:hypothetical protein